MKKTLIIFVFATIINITGTNGFARSFDIGDGTLDVYASIRAFAVYNNTDGGDVVARDYSQFVLGLQSISRVGVKWTHGDFSFRNEIGMGGSDSRPPVYLRFLYGDYKPAGGDSGRIRIGQIPGISDTGSFYDHKLNDDDALLGFGTLTDVRRVGVNYEIGGFSISALSVRQDQSGLEGLYAGYGYDVEFIEIMPRIEAAYSISDIFTAAGSFVQTAVDNKAHGKRGRRYNIDAYHLMLVAAPKIGDNVKIIASGFYSVNGGIYGMAYTGGGHETNTAVDFNRVLPQLKTGTEKAETENTSAFGGAVALRADAFEIGFGYQSTRNNAWKEAINGMGLYANYRYKLSPNFTIIPEIGYFNCGNRGSVPKSVEKAPRDTRAFQAGVQFRIDI
jgi:hypothetical protein